MLQGLDELKILEFELLIYQHSQRLTLQCTVMMTFAENFSVVFPRIICSTGSVLFNKMIKLLISA